MDPKKYHYNRYMGLIIPNDPKDTELLIVLMEYGAYYLYVDKRRRFANVKELFLKRLIRITEKDRSYAEPFHVRTMLLFRKQCLTIAEMLAN
jgi:hypothetical protein